MAEETETTRGIEIVVPIHGAAKALERCLASLGAHVSGALANLLLVLDGPQEAAIEALAGRFVAAAPGRRLLRQAERRGFAAAANLAIRSSEGDLLLVNSDVVATARFVEKLAAAARSQPRIGTATPFTNHGTICSLPRPLEENDLPTGFTLDAFADLVERASKRLRPPVPTGVGFCLFVRRDLIDDIGLFDESYGLGYGEETDLCLRAAERGWQHVLDDSTFVFHAGEASFGGEAARRRRAAGRRLARRHPGFRARLARFLAEDPLSEARRPILDALAAGSAPALTRSAAPPRSVVHLVHGFPPDNFAGVEMAAFWLAHWQRARRDVAVYSRCERAGRATGWPIERLDRGVRVRAIVNHHDRRDPRARNALRDPRLARDFARFLDETAPELVHIHHLAGHAIALVEVVRRRGIPIVFHLHDWWMACARGNLLDRELRLCPGPSPGRCATCLPLTGLAPAPLANRLLYRMRRRAARRALAAADVLVLGSRTLAASLEELGTLPPDVPRRIVPYAIPLAGAARREPPPAGNGPIRFGMIAWAHPAKGLDIATRAFRDLSPKSATLDFWGDARRDPEFVAEAIAAAGAATVRLHPPFPEGGKAEIFAGLDAFIAPSRGLESFGLAAHEALAAGVPVLASTRCALAELFPSGEGCGATFDPDEPGALRAWIDRIVADPAMLDRWRAVAPVEPVYETHALAIESVYEEAMARRRPGPRG